jgi:phage shock protein E
MDWKSPQSFLVPVLFVGFIIWRFARFRGVKRQIPALLSGGAVIVDVRSRGEYQVGAREGSINIPLDELEQGAARLDPATPVVVCCASGTRSAMAAATLRRKGFAKVVNAGPWTNTLT